MSATPVLNPRPWLVSLKGLLFPPACLLCNCSMGLSEEAAVCARCRPHLPLRNQPACPLCGEFFERDGSCGGCANYPNGIGGEKNLAGEKNQGRDGLFFLYRYGRSARRLVHRMKITADPRAGVWLGSELRRLTQPPSGPFDAVIPVPSHRRQLLGSPANNGAAGLWADALGSFFQIPVRSALVRSKTVPKQTTLDRSRRLMASESSLAVREPLLKGCRSVILADDVMTTGATANACTRALKTAGVDRVTLAAVGRG